MCNPGIVVEREACAHLVWVKHHEGELFALVGIDKAVTDAAGYAMVAIVCVPSVDVVEFPEIAVFKCLDHFLRTVEHSTPRQLQRL